MKRFILEFKKNSTSKIKCVTLYALDKESAKYELTKYFDHIAKKNIIWIRVEELK